ncbi:hypothetical protein [Dyella sp.]|uniref:hypothetical protein n=1 Tax=Dyella sp. TaxID=1869338 RepID=UPI002D777355|nr:hypothetical protein [Dyella sp.]HET6432828.1 hypothetical protein [Dyella sp.]
MKNQLLPFFALFLSVLVTHKSNATEVEKIIWCDGCTGAQKLSLVRSDPAFNTKNSFYVGDMRARVIQKYHVTREEKPQGGGYNTLVLAVAPEPDVTASFKTLTDFYYAGDPGFTKHFYFQIIDSTSPNTLSYREFYTGKGFSENLFATPTGGAQLITPVLDYPNPRVNVYGVVNQSPAQNALLDFATTGFKGQINTLADQALKVASTALPLDPSRMPRIVAVVKFADGSQIAIELDTSSTNAHYAIVKESARDSHNNTVPVTKDMIDGDGLALYDFSEEVGNPNDRINMQSQLGWLGALSAPGSGSSSGSIGTGGFHGWACTSTTVNGNTTYTCRAY